LKVLAVNGTEPWVRSLIMTHFLLAESPAGRRDLCQSLADSYHDADPIGVATARALVFGKFMEDSRGIQESAPGSLTDKIVRILFDDVKSASTKQVDPEKLSLWFNALDKRSVMDKRDVTPYVAPILDGEFSEEVKVSAVATLAPRALEWLEPEAREESSFQNYKNSTLSFVTSLYLKQPGAKIKEVIFEVYAKLGDKTNLSQLEDWKRSDPGAASYIERAVEEIKGRSSR